MTPEQVALVQGSFKSVEPMADEAAALFYGRLFEIAPTTRSLFTHDLDEQGRKLMEMLSVVVTNLHDLDSILPAAEALAIRHVGYGVDAEHYIPVGEALLWTLAAGLGDAFTPAVEEAWAAAYGLLSDVMTRVAYPGVSA